MTGYLLDSTAYDETRLKRGPMTTQIIVDATKPVGLPFAIRITPPPRSVEVFVAIGITAAIGLLLFAGGIIPRLGCRCGG